MIEIQILTPIPSIAEGLLGESILGRARESGLVKVEAVDLRRWTSDRHRTVDDAPYGGGPGMVMKIERIGTCRTQKARFEGYITKPPGKNSKAADCSGVCKD